jgi:hypothetical protein
VFVDLCFRSLAKFWCPGVLAQWPSELNLEQAIVGSSPFSRQYLVIFSLCALERRNDRKILLLKNLTYIHIYNRYIISIVLQYCYIFIYHIT